MTFSYIGFGLCLGMAIGSFISGNDSAGIIQLLCACANIPGMLPRK